MAQYGKARVDERQRVLHAAGLFLRPGACHTPAVSDLSPHSSGSGLLTLILGGVRELV